MKTKTTHTPTPWQAEETEVNFVTYLSSKTRDIGKIESREDAAFIIRAVNAHEELVKALEESLKLQSHYAGLLNSYDSGTRLTFSTVEQWLNRLNAIAKAEGR